MKIDNIVKFFSNNKIGSFFLKKVYRIFLKKRIADYKKNNYLKHSEEVLYQAKQALDSVNVFFWLEFGTLLGAFRENDFIKSDSDIDLGVFLDDYSIDIDRAMVNYGFRKVKQFELDNGAYGLEQTYSYRGVSLDLFYFTKKSDDEIRTHSFATFKNIKVEEKENFDYRENEMATIEIYMPSNGFSRLIFKDNEYNVPRNLDGYLSYHYGADYKIPRAWDYTDLINDHKNAILIEKKLSRPNKHN